MPFYVKLLRWYYIFLTVLVLLAPLKYSFWQFLPSLMLLWISYFVFKLGCIKGIKVPVKSVKSDSNAPLAKWFFVFTIGMLIFIPLYVRFYTGGNLGILALGFYSNVGTDSNYQEYQRYFVENNLDQFSLSKLPYIVGYGLTKLLFYFFVFAYIGFSKKISKVSISLIVVLFLLYSMVGMARGTSFENFELLILLMFATLTRAKIVQNQNFYNKSQLANLLIIVVLIGGAFVINKSLRSDGDALGNLSGPTSTLMYDSSSLIMDIIPSIGKIALSFSGYFVFGLYYTSELFWKIWLNSTIGLSDMIIPFGAPYIDGLTSYRLELESLGVDCGACWSPDISGFAFYLGLPLIFVLIYLMGIMSGKAYNKTLKNLDVGYCMVLYLIVYEMISLHVGNFLVISSSNKIMLLAVIMIICFNMFYKYRIRKV